MSRKASDLTATDLFCGAGGSSLGVESAGVRLRMALNHWELAIETHNTNFPNADHDCTDISATDPRRYPSTNILIASPECTNHSLAKGKKRSAQQDFFVPSHDPAAVRSRATMWDVPRFAEFHDYEAVIVENVVDARRWVMYDAWIQAMHSLGYEHRAVCLNSMFCHPTPQSRDRLYVVFWKKGNLAPDLEIEPRGFCPKCECDVDAVQSWKPNRTWGRYKQQYLYLCPRCTTEVQPYYYAAINAIDFGVAAERIGDRKRPLKERTLRRIQYGLEKYGQDPLVVVTNMTTDAGRVRSALRQAGFTQTGSNLTALVAPFLTSVNYYDDRNIPVHQPMGTQTTQGKFGVTLPAGFITTLRRNQSASALSDVLGTICTSGAHHAVCLRDSALITLRDSPRMVFNELNETLPTQVAAGYQTAIISRSAFLSSYYGQMQAGGMDEAMGTLSTRDRHALVEPDSLEVEDCYFRMLQPHEIQAGMASHRGYQVLGNKSQVVKQLGNAVNPPVMKLLGDRVAQSLEAA